MGRFKKGETGNPNGRPPGSKNKRTVIREALAKVYDNGEEGFWLAVAEKAKEGDGTAMTMLAARLIAPLRASDATVKLEGLDAGSLVEKAERIVASMGEGELSPSEATAMVNAIATLCRVQETDDLVKRIEALESQQEAS